jgi:hypothetical protein
MVALPARPTQEIINRVYEAIEKKDSKPELYLGRLGSSFIGTECIRQIWLDWRGYSREQFSGRMLRLFNTGHIQEARVVEDLRLGGFEVWDKDETGKQFEFNDSSGHFITKTDGVIKGVPGSEKVAHLLEIKTHNKNSFSGIVKKGVQESKPTHYAQMQISMALSGLTRGLYVSVCKDDEQYYVERIKEDPVEQKKLSTKIIKLVEARMWPAGISDDGSSFGCKFCSMKAVCTKEVEPLKTCRSCDNCVPLEAGTWGCELQHKVLSSDEQRAACEHYEVL